jgi:hypothetical protein
LKIFQEYSKNNCQKEITKAVKKKANVAFVILFAPYGWWISIFQKEIIFPQKSP